MGEVSMLAGLQDIGLVVLACSRELEPWLLNLCFCLSLAQTPTSIGATNDSNEASLAAMPSVLVLIHIEWP